MFDPTATNYKCKYTNIDRNGVATVASRYVGAKMYYPTCPRMNSTTCNKLAGAYVAAVTVCQMRLW